MNKETKAVCPNCGAVLEWEGKAHCEVCGWCIHPSRIIYKDGVEICSTCGRKVKKEVCKICRCQRIVEVTICA